MIGKTLSTKVATFGAQIALAWLLLEEDFGLFGMAVTVAAFSELVEWAGTRDVLVRRAQRVHLWLGPAFWLSLSAGLLAAGIMLVIAPFAAWGFGEPMVVPLVAILALRGPLQGLSIPPAAYLQTQFRFRTLALVGSAHIVTGAGLTVVLALLGFGAYSFAIPIPVAAGFQAAALWLIARPPINWRGGGRRWRYMVGDSSTLTFANLLRALVTRGDYLVLGIFHDAAVVGVYFFAFNLSSQLLRMMTTNLAQVLMPVISKLKHDPQRQLHGFLRACEGLMAIGIPICLLNAAVAEPVFRLLFGTKWDAAIPVFQILCLGMAMRMADGASFAMIKGAGRYRTFLRLCLVSSLIFVVVAVPASAWGGMIAVAWTVAAWSAGFGPAAMYLGIRHLGGRPGQIVSIVIRPTLAAVPTIGLAYLLASAVPGAWPGRELVQIGLIVSIGGLGYILLMPRLMPAAWQILTQRVQRLMDRRGERRATLADAPPSANLDGEPTVHRHAGEG